MRKFKAKPGQLVARYGPPSKREAPDLLTAWGGEGASKSDAMMLSWHITEPRPRGRYAPLAANGHPVVDPSLLQELERRGYDLTTLRFSIMMKPQSQPMPTPNPQDETK